MPRYEYEHLDGEPEDCLLVVEVIQSMTDDPLTECPACGRKVRRIISRVAGHISREGQAYLKERGFKRLIKRDTGVYEEG